MPNGARSAPALRGSAFDVRCSMFPEVASSNLFRTAMRWLVFAFATATASAAADSRWLTRAWQTDDGLPNNHVTAIVQGDDGYLWIGTPAGLTRFDGFRFTPFAYDNPGENENPGIRWLSVRKAGGLWIVP